jgi:hypothetical protein
VLRDFSVTDDTFQLSQSLFAGISAAGTLDASAFHVGTSALDASDRIIFDQAGGGIYYDADGNGAGQQVLFARVAAGTALRSGDFTVDASGQSSLQSASVEMALADTAKGTASTDAHMAEFQPYDFAAPDAFTVESFHTAMPDHYII